LNLPKEKKMKRTLGVSLLLVSLFWTLLGVAAETNQPLWQEWEDEEAAKNGFTVLVAKLPKTKSVCGVLTNNINKLIITVDVIKEDGRYLFSGIISEERSNDNRTRFPKISVRNVSVEIEMKPFGLWIPTLDRSTKLFETYCPLEVLRLLPQNIQSLFGGNFGVGQGRGI